MILITHIYTQNTKAHKSLTTLKYYVILWIYYEVLRAHLIFLMPAGTPEKRISVNANVFITPKEITQCVCIMFIKQQHTILLSNFMRIKIILITLSPHTRQ